MRPEFPVIVAFSGTPVLAELPSFFSGLLTPVIAVIAAYIAYQQWRLNRASLKHNLYDRRLKVYQGLVDLLYQAGVQGVVDEDRLSRFRAVRYFADFLFEEDIVRFLDEVDERAAKFTELLAIDEFEKRNAQEVSADDPAARLERHQELATQRKWFKFQYLNSKDRFRKYFEIKV